MSREMSFPFVCATPANPPAAWRVHTPTSKRSKPARANAIEKATSGDAHEPSAKAFFNNSICSGDYSRLLGRVKQRSGLRLMTSELTPLTICSTPKKIITKPTSDIFRANRRSLDSGTR